MVYELFSQTTLVLISAALLLLFVGCFGQLRAAQKALHAARARLAQVEQDSYFNNLVVASANDGLIVQNLDGIILWANPAYFVLQGLPPDKVIGRNPLSFCLPPEDTPNDDEIANFRYASEDPNFSTLQQVRNLRGNGEIFWNQISVSFRVAPSGEQHAILVCRDVTEQVENEVRLRETSAQLTFSATHDGLTQIPNRGTMVAACTRQLALAEEQGTRVGLLHLDIDFFKEINDSKGHGAGDATLIHVARKLQAAARPNDLVARVGGDEFIMVCPAVQGLPELKDLGELLAKSIDAPIMWQHHNISCKVSIGAALSEPSALDPEDLIQHSDFALYEVKRTGRGRVATYDEDLHQRHSRMSLRSAELSAALRGDGLEFYFQPVVIWPQRRLLGFETLVRWRHPTEGLQSPAEFLPMAADLGLMADLDLAAMQAGIDLKLALRTAGYPNKVISLNASAEGLLHPEYVSRLKTLCERHNIAPKHITVEVLETVMFDDQMSMSDHADVISALRQHGFLTVLDDFGVGHAGLAHLAQLSLSGVKIDRSLVSQVLIDKASARIVTTVLDLCTDLGLDVIGEGVETVEIADAMQALGCDIMQGFGIARPMPLGEVLPWVAQFSANPATARPRRTGAALTRRA